MPDQEISTQKLKTLLKAINILMVNQDQDARAEQACSWYYNNVSAIRQTFIRQQGLRRYIHEMLGVDAHQPVGKCRLLTMLDRAPLEIGDAWANRPLVDFLTECYTAETIPCFMVVLDVNGRTTEKLL